MLRLLKAGNASTMTFAKSGHPSTWTLGSSVGFECKLTACRLIHLTRWTGFSCWQKYHVLHLYCLANLVGGATYFIAAAAK